MLRWLIVWLCLGICAAVGAQDVADGVYAAPDFGLVVHVDGDHVTRYETSPVHCLLTYSGLLTAAPFAPHERGRPLHRARLVGTLVPDASRFHCFFMHFSLR